MGDCPTGFYYEDQLLFVNGTAYSDPSYRLQFYNDKLQVQPMSHSGVCLESVSTSIRIHGQSILQVPINVIKISFKSCYSCTLFPIANCMRFAM